MTRKTLVVAGSTIFVILLILLFIVHYNLVLIKTVSGYDIGSYSGQSGTCNASTGSYHVLKGERADFYNEASKIKIPKLSNTLDYCSYDAVTIKLYL